MTFPITSLHIAFSQRRLKDQMMDPQPRRFAFPVGFFCHIFLVLVVFLSNLGIAQAQSRSELESRRQKLIKDIRQTNE
ncbi:MAG: hypothetical protein AAGD05_09260, partial [Bacteroidota bacterium]